MSHWVEAEPAMAPVRITVAGDVLTELHLLRDLPRGSAPGGSRSGIWREQAGGASRLPSLIRLACADLAPEVAGPDETARQARAALVWSQFEAGPGERRTVWRVAEYLGCEQASPGEPSGVNGPAADVLVLADHGLGFAHQPERWPDPIVKPDSRVQIVLECNGPIGETALWSNMLDRWADRLTVVLDVEALRDRGASIARAVSWDLAIEQIVREVQHGPSAADLGRCRRVVIRFGLAGAASFTRDPAPFEAPNGRRRTGRLGERARFERFVFHPADLEGAWESRYPGRVPGVLSVLTAAVTRHVLEPQTCPIFLTLGRALAAGRVVQQRGGGPPERFDPATGLDGVGPVLQPAPDTPEPADPFRAAFPHDILSDPLLSVQPGTESNLLRDFTGTEPDAVAVHAAEVVIRGPDRALTAVPCARYGKYLTADRQEIERINAIRNLLLGYSASRDDRRPLSIAVFGPPGSGKSFAVKQLTRDLFRGARLFEFNLSQLDTVAALHEAFHQIRDAGLRGEIPVVFWDEFDTGGLRWLSPFLAPMQDGEFYSGGISHPLGRAIFVFAGGTAATMEAFDRSRVGGPDEAGFRLAKGPDFVSRLRGYVDIKGPDQVGPSDTAHLIRRSIILRATIERLFPNLIDAATRQAKVSRSVIAGFLRVNRYLHGARSLEAIVSMSDLSTASHFTAGRLPSSDLLRLHVTPDFAEHVRQGEIDSELIEVLAEAFHEAWRVRRLEEGWQHGPERHDTGKRHPRLVPYRDLTEAYREDNRAPARLAHARLRAIGYRVAKQHDGLLPASLTDNGEMERLAVVEHDRWLREKLLHGFAWSEATDERLRLHRDVAPFALVTEAYRQLEAAQVNTIEPTLKQCGYILTRSPA
jgi:hypothetical protein